MKQKLLLLLLLLSFIPPIEAHEDEITIVPYPSDVVVDAGNYFTLTNNYTVKSDKQFSAVQDLLIDEIALLTSNNGTKGSLRVIFC